MARRTAGREPVTLNVNVSIAQIDAVAVVWVMLCWFGFALPFVFRKRPPKTKERKRDRTSQIGLLIQAAAYGVVWTFRRPIGTPFLPHGFWWRLALDLFAVAAASWAVWLAFAAVYVLGKEFALTARVVEDHRLVTEGPYQIVRHPIYTSMLAMLVATGLVISQWTALLVALPVFAVGTAIRVRTEERLLRETFGDAYDAYARRVPSVLPFPRFGR